MAPRPDTPRNARLSAPFKMQRILIQFAVTLGLLPLVARAVGPDYLFDDREPADRVSDLATPLSEIEAAEPRGKLFRDTDEPFIRDLEFSLRPRFYFRSLRNASGLNNTFAGGGSVGFTTGWWREMIQFGVAGFTSQPLAKNQNGRDRTGLVAPDGDGFSVLGLAWAQLKASPATATIYRQELHLPFIHANDSRLIPNTFEAYQIEVKPLEFLRFGLGYVARIKLRNGDTFIPMSEAAGAPQVNRGTGFAGFVFGAEDKTYLGAITETTFDLYTSTYAQTGHTWRPGQEWEVRGDLQFADQRGVGKREIGDFDTQFYGAQLSAGYGGVVGSLAYTYTSSGQGLLDPYGAAPGFNGLMISNFAAGGESSYGAGLSYDFGTIGLDGLTAFASYVYGTLPSGGWEQEINGTVDYRMNSGFFRNLWLRVRYAYNESGAGVPINDFRAILNYTVTF